MRPGHPKALALRAGVEQGCCLSATCWADLGSSQPPPASPPPALHPRATSRADQGSCSEWGPDPPTPWADLGCQSASVPCWGCFPPPWRPRTPLTVPGPGCPLEWGERLKGGKGKPRGPSWPTVFPPPVPVRSSSRTDIRATPPPAPPPQRPLTPVLAHHVLPSLRHRLLESPPTFLTVTPHTVGRYHYTKRGGRVCCGNAALL